MLVPSERKLFLAFLERHASDDVLIQAMNRVTSNLEDVKELKKYVSNYRPDMVPTPEMPSGESVTVRDAEIETPEDLGPVPKKLGKNGQAVEAFLRKHHGDAASVATIGQSCKIPVSKVKPMVALLIARDIVERVGSNHYKIKEQ